jgi:hypothetical protein
MRGEREMITQRFKTVTVVHLLLIKNGKILLLRRFQTGLRFSGRDQIVYSRNEARLTAVETIAWT